MPENFFERLTPKRDVLLGQLQTELQLRSLHYSIAKRLQLALSLSLSLSLGLIANCVGISNQGKQKKQKKKLIRLE